ncbi:hypothetical protein AZF37_07195 [endosymbiont 'TC1' of Trimyema compressum]|uniref:hypothetical protein n=1 Tax=endosymbiont 'TC1' of Trimyema compressum TaxID=243899 RepID=UPI0007F08D7E|nr:hypothetical protein [endosymbiont 'TC1' of Trimyema compressum]AMP20974.1 hypothetical protein AZF37_07195 [endosymbiont 'TC1' of Trimyema compressum]
MGSTITISAFVLGIIVAILAIILGVTSIAKKKDSKALAIVGIFLGIISIITVLIVGRLS